MADHIANLAMDGQCSIQIKDPTSAVGQKLVELDEQSLKERIYSRPVQVATRAMACREEQQRLQQPPKVTEEWSRIRGAQLRAPWMKKCITWIEAGERSPLNLCQNSYSMKCITMSYG